MVHYATFDVSDKETAIHMLDERGRLVWKGKRPSEPEALAGQTHEISRLKTTLDREISATRDKRRRS